MAKKAKSDQENLPKTEAEGPEILPVPVEEPSAPVKLVEEAEELPAPIALVAEKTEEFPAPIKLVEETPVAKKPSSAQPRSAAEAVKTEPPAPLILPQEEVEVGTGKAKPGFLKWLFDAETSRGRLARKITRWAAGAIGFFGVGFLLAYLTLYLPLSQRLDTSREEISSLNTQLITTQNQLDLTQGELTDAKTHLAQSEETAAKTQIELNASEIQLKLMNVLYLATQARLDWMSNNQAETLSRLVMAQGIFDQIKPEIQAKNDTLVDLVDEQMNTAIDDIIKKAPSAPSALEKLHRTLKSLQDLFTESAP